MANCLKWQETEFKWKVHYFNMCAQFTEEPIRSPAFSLDSLGVTKFILYLYPKGRFRAQKQCATIYLVGYKSENETNEEKYLHIQLKVFVDNEEQKPIHTDSTLQNINKNMSWTKITSLDRGKILKKDIFEHVHLTILLNINPLRREIKTNEMWVCSDEDLEILSSDFSKALENSKHSDFTLKGNGDACFRVHKPILTFRYPHLAKVLRLHRNTTKESRLRKGTLTLKYLLQYLYSGKTVIENVPSEIYGVLDDNELLHLQYLLFPVPESTTAETRISVRSGCFIWTIPNFINLPKTVTLSNFLSHENSLKWTKLKITCYFRQSKENEECVAFSINRIFTEVPVYVACKIEVLASTEYIREYEHLFEEEAEWILPPYISTKFLIDNKLTLLQSEALKIKFLIQISDGTSTNEVSFTHSPKITVNQQYSPAMNLCALQRDFRKLYKNSILSDVTIHVGEETFRAHKVVLSARSSVFSKMLEREALDDQSGKIVIKDFKTAVVQAMLSYMYCGEVENVQLDLNFVMDLYSITDKYQISQLKAKCVNYFKSELDAENIGKLLILADAHCDNHLKTYIKDFACSNADKVSVSKEWNQIMSDRVDLATDMLLSALSFIVSENSNK